MARPRLFDKNEVLDRAMNIFHRYGYDGATMADLTIAMGLSAPSIYAAFENKRGLFYAVLDRHAELRAERFDWVLSAPSARDVAERLLYSVVEQTAFPGSPGSLLIQAGLSAGPENADIPVALAQQRLSDEVRLRKRFEKAAASGDLSVGEAPETSAKLVATMFDGLCVKAASGFASDELSSVVNQFMSNWEKHIAVPACNIPRPDIRHQSLRGRPREFLTSEALEAAMRVFWCKGFEGTSMTDLTTAMGISRPSLYTTFGNKELLFLSALDHYQREYMAFGLKALKAPTARAFVKELLEGAVAAQLSPGRPRGCLSVINSMQGSDQSQTVRAEVLRRSAEVHKLMADRLERARIEGDLSSSQDPEGLASLLASVLQSIATLGAAGASANALNALVSSTLAIWP